jgi:O-antigen/teichoic acid export membrane protein
VTLTTVEDRQMLAMAFTVFLLHSLTFVVNQLDIWIGEAILPPDELGVYGVAKRCMLLAAMPVQMAMMTIAGTIPRLHAQGRRRELQNLMRGSAGVAAVPALAALLILVLAPELVVGLLFGHAYSGAATSIRILAVGHLVLIAAGNSFAMLSLNGRHNTVLPVSMIAVAFLAVAGPPAALWYGASGLAWVSTGAVMIQSGLLWWLAYLRSGIWTHVGIPHRHVAGSPAIDAITAAPYVQPARPTLARIREATPIAVEVGADFSNIAEDL